MATQLPKTVIISDEVIERDMTAEEYESIKAEQDRLAAEKAEEATNAALRAEQKAGLLERLGITEEEAELLLS